MWRLKRLLFKSTEDTREYSREELQKKALHALADKYDCLAVIGTGAYSDIIALWSRSEQTTVAAKVLHPKMTSAAEVKLWPRLRHHNIVPVLKVIRRADVDIFLMPHYSRTLMYILEDAEYRTNPNSFTFMLHWMTGILCGLEYLHLLDICHLDLKTDNIMITAQNIAVIGDFSSIEFVKGPTENYALPRYYCPPEAWPLNFYGPRPKVDGKAFDIWSFGMILFYCFSDRWMEYHLWGRTDWWNDIFPLIDWCFKVEVYYRLMSKAFPHSEITRLKATYSMNLVKGVLRYYSQDRPTPTAILSHALLKKNGKDLLEPDIIWTHDKHEVFKFIVRAKLERIIKRAALDVKCEDEKEAWEAERKEKDAAEYKTDPVQVPLTSHRSLWNYFCCCCPRREEGV